MKKIENNIFLILSIYLKQNFWLCRANDLWLKKKRGIQKKKYAEANYLCKTSFEKSQYLFVVLQFNSSGIVYPDTETLHV